MRMEGTIGATGDTTEETREGRSVSVMPVMGGRGIAVDQVVTR